MVALRVIRDRACCVLSVVRSAGRAPGRSYHRAEECFLVAGGRAE